MDGFVSLLLFYRLPLTVADYKLVLILIRFEWLRDDASIKMFVKYHLITLDFILVIADNVRRS